MRGLTCLITGATDGIGKEAAIELAKKGCNLILIGRNKEKGEKVVELIRKLAENYVDIDYFTADLMLMKEVSRGKRITKEKLHSIIKNLDIPATEKGKLLKLTPSTYLGLSKKLAKKV